MSDFADARAYERLMGRWSAPLARQLVRFAGVTDGARALDVGCGTGALTAALLEVGPRVEVEAIDLSPAFVGFARERIGATRARVEVGDAQRLAFPDQSFDWVGSMLVLNFVPDRERAASEMRRVAKRGCPVSACVWDYGGEMEMLRRFWDAATALDPQAASRHEARMPLCRPGELGSLWRAAGFEGVCEGSIGVAMRFVSFEDYWGPFCGGVGPSGAYVASLSIEARQALAALLRAELWSDEPQRERTLEARAWTVAGSVS